MVVEMVEQGKERKATPTTTATEPREFREIIEPLELAAGVRLRGKNRRKVRAAFHENAGGLHQVAKEALAGGRNPLALLVFKVCEDQHLDDLRPLEAREGRPTALHPPWPPCPSCGIGGGRHLTDCKRARGSDNRTQAA